MGLGISFWDWESHFGIGNLILGLGISFWDCSKNLILGLIKEAHFGIAQRISFWDCSKNLILGLIKESHFGIGNLILGLTLANPINRGGFFQLKISLLLTLKLLTSNF